MDVTSISGVVLGMVGFGAFVSAVVSVLKTFGVVQDGDSQTWVTGFNLLGVIAIYIAKAAGTEVDLVTIDANLSTAATLLIACGQLVVSLGGSKLFYSTAKGMPVLGKTFSKEQPFG
ncbi:MAG: hypothetical protein M0Q91_12220 [Methanoregula sp.]|jgi:D-arabinose 1-dehydrogenase-like Zn-dependent alcohol dehydrogenase|nr:hypothetical protein [Methanoregula sp.]